MKVLPLFLALSALALVPVLPRLQAQELPDGKGKELVESVCSSCHGLEAVVSQHADKQGWESIVSYMVSRGMVASDEEFNTMVAYLAKAFPAQPAKAPGDAAPAKPADPAKP